MSKITSISRQGKQTAEPQRPQPATEAEKALLGCLLLEPARIGDAITAGITRPMFDDLGRGIVWQILARMYQAGQPVDTVTLAGELKKFRRFPGDAITLLSELQDAAATGGLACYYFQPVLDAGLKLAAWKVGLRLQDAACDPGSDAESLKADAQNAVDSLFRGVACELPALVDAAAFIAEPLPEPRQVVRGLLHQSSKLSIGGGSKSFKTWTLLDLALSVGHGVPWIGFETARGPVCYVNFEIQAYSWQGRIKAVASAKGIAIDPCAVMLLNMRGKAANHEQLIPALIHALRGKGFVLIILDPVYKLYGRTDENAAGDVAALLNGFECLAVETGAAVAFGAHFSKGNQAAKESIDRVSGSGVFSRDPDSLLVMTRHEQEGAFTVEATLRNFPSVEPFVVRWEYPLMCRDSELNPAKLKQAAGRKPTSTAVELLTLLKSEPLTTSEWKNAAAVSKWKVSKTKFYDQLDELTTSGKAIKTPEDKWKIA